jgi:adenylosuccinate lyase
MLMRCTRLIDGLVVNADRMMFNLERTGGLCFSEAVLLRLVRAGLPRQEAYVMVQRCALAAHGGDGTFRENLGADADISSRLSAEDLDAAFDLAHHLRHVDTIFQRAFR